MEKKFVSNKDETIRLFRSDFLESLSHVHWSVPLWLFAPTVLFCLYRSTWETPLQSLAWFACGLGIWTITEYSLHRFVFHCQPRKPWLQKVHFYMHGVHHDYPMDSKRLVMPPAVSVPVVFLFFCFFALVFGSGVMPLFAGFLSGYLCYDMIHFAVHHRPMRAGIWRALKRHHTRHHFEDPGRGFGVSTPLWDYLLGSNFLVRKK